MPLNPTLYDRAKNTRPGRMEGLHDAGHALPSSALPIKTRSQPFSMARFLSLVLLMGVGIMGDRTTPEASGETDMATNVHVSIISTSMSSTNLNNSDKTAVYSIQSASTGSEPVTSPKSPDAAPTSTATRLAGHSTDQKNNQQRDCEFFLCHINGWQTLLLIGALSLTCLILLTATLTLACNMCALKKKMVFTVQTTRRESVDCETGPMITKAGKQEEDGNQSGPEWPEEPEEPEKPDEPDEPVVEAAEATEDSNQAPAEDSTLLPPPADEAPPNQECETSGESAASCGQRPVGSVLWAASCGQRPVGSVLWAASCGAASCGAASCGAASCGQRPVGSVLLHTHTHTHTPLGSAGRASPEVAGAALEQLRGFTCSRTAPLPLCLGTEVTTHGGKPGADLPFEEPDEKFYIREGGEKESRDQAEGSDDRRPVKRRRYQHWTLFGQRLSSRQVCAVKMHGRALLSRLLLLLSLLGINAACPSVCSCRESEREVDCSWRGLRHLPNGLQLNLYSLNLSHNRLVDLDYHLSSYTHLRTLDISNNRLSRLPASLPRSLWDIRASGNRIRLLEKNDTAYHWNLQMLDLSANKLERVVFINNTLPSLRALNLSHNRFWTVPTNMPQNLELVDLSHNTLVQILPESLDRLPKLARFYLHANRFSTVSEGAFEKLHSLRLITLGGNPWACEDRANISHLLAWAKHTSARVLGCPCHTWPICGEAHLARTGGWHFASYTLSPFGTAQVQGTYTHYWTEKALTVPHHTREAAGASNRPDEYGFKHGFALTSTSDDLSALQSYSPTEVPFPEEDLLTTDSFFTTGRVSTSSTRRTTTLRTRSVKRANQGLGRNGSPGHSCGDIFVIVLLLLVTTHHYM
ncbi:hypothetical protein NFI96_006547 [Prochilodus magdalenae]|nr:hypothetical protein NFI96_006547 [Prochilodus magdalenae]